MFLLTTFLIFTKNKSEEIKTEEVTGVAQREKSFYCTGNGKRPRQIIFPECLENIQKNVRGREITMTSLGFCFRPLLIKTIIEDHYVKVGLYVSFVFLQY